DPVEQPLSARGPTVHRVHPLDSRSAGRRPHCGCDGLVAGFCDCSVAVQARSGVGRGAAQLAVDGGAGDAEQLGELGLGVFAGRVQRQQVLALRGRELGLLAFEFALDACDRVFSSRCIVHCMLTIASRLDVMNRLGRALADPTRSRIILTLLDHPAYPAELARDLDLTRPNVSNHLACLRDCGIVVSEPEGRRTRYEIADSHLAQALTALVDATLAVDEDAPCIDPACSLPGCDAAGEGA